MNDRQSTTPMIQRVCVRRFAPASGRIYVSDLLVRDEGS